MEVKNDNDADKVKQVREYIKKQLVVLRKSPLLNEKKLGAC